MYWIEGGSLAVAGYPGHASERTAIRLDSLDRWIAETQLEGIRLILCLLEPDELPAYEVPLPKRYRDTCFGVVHHPICEEQGWRMTEHPPALGWQAYQQLPNPLFLQGQSDNKSVLRRRHSSSLSNSGYCSRWGKKPQDVCAYLLYLRRPA
jgi:hypothetical protein